VPKTKDLSAQERSLIISLILESRILIIPILSLAILTKYFRNFFSKVDYKFTSKTAVQKLQFFYVCIKGDTFIAIENSETISAIIIVKSP